MLHALLKMLRGYIPYDFVICRTRYLRCAYFSSIHLTCKSARDLLVKVLAACLRNGTWCSWIEHVRDAEKGDQRTRVGEMRKKHISNDSTRKQEQVLRKAGQWRLWGHCQSWIEIPILTWWARCESSNPRPRSTLRFRL